uniref:Uncharacterized protein n=1 Tax=Anguilla anguilla TaxID=7936 RepID=A0A0E9RWU7_ANGAN
MKGLPVSAYRQYMGSESVKSTTPNDWSLCVTLRTTCPSHPSVNWA